MHQLAASPLPRLAAAATSASWPATATHPPLPHPLLLPPQPAAASPPCSVLEPRNPRPPPSRPSQSSRPVRFKFGDSTSSRISGAVAGNSSATLLPHCRHQFQWLYRHKELPATTRPGTGRDSESVALRRKPPVVLLSPSLVRCT